MHAAFDPMTRAWLPALCLIAVSDAAAQAPEPPVFTAETGLVNVVVTVRDKNDHLVSDLTEADFSVTVNGKPEKIVLFARSGDRDEENVDRVSSREHLVVDAGLLLDTSQSMQEPLKLAKEAAIRFLDSVPRARDLLTLFFDQDIRVSRYDSEHQQGLFERILDAEAAGNTALYDAIAVYLSRVEDTAGRKVLVLFTDGADSISKTTPGDLRDLVRSSAVTIYPISFAENLPTSERNSARSFLGTLAEMSGGKVLSPRSSKDLGSIFDGILDELHAQYVIGIEPDRAARNGDFRRLKVEVKRNGLEARHRPGYVVAR